MADIRKITLLDGGSYAVGETLFSEKYGKSVVENIYTCYISIEAELLPAFRIYIEEKGSPYLEIPYHAVKLVFYS